MWDLPGPGLKPVSPALAGGFLTTAPPGKTLFGFLNDENLFLMSNLPFYNLNLLIFLPSDATSKNLLFF